MSDAGSDQELLTCPENHEQRSSAAVGAADIRPLTDAEAALWGRLVDKIRSFYQARMELFKAKKEFLAPGTDRVSLMRYALRGQEGAAAIEVAAELPPDELIQIFSELVFVAGYGHHLGNLPAVRELIGALPRDWVLQNIEETVEPMLIDATYWEYRRLLELYATLDGELTRRLALRALQHADAEIHEAGQDALESLANNEC